VWFAGADPHLETTRDPGIRFLVPMDTIRTIVDYSIDLSFVVALFFVLGLVTHSDELGESATPKRAS
jgi:hypothetical protein